MYQRIADAFAMTDAAWARHQNPWSVWTRVAILPALTALLLWRDALGPWLWPLLGALLAWTWANPRAFPPPADPQTWSARAVRGERRWLADRKAPAAARVEARALSPALGAPIWLWGVIAERPWIAFAGAAAVILLKLRFLDAAARMEERETC
ncbi:DUF6653 family protein [Rhodovulum sp. DZ06]|uniref:DUF6653 family protein n=1 Tax=Rhodovulum sp. DZ06 TaxID=3425126 RepID=UPI003D338B9C